MDERFYIKFTMCHHLFLHLPLHHDCRHFPIEPAVKAGDGVCWNLNRNSNIIANIIAINIVIDGSDITVIAKKNT